MNASFIKSIKSNCALTFVKNLSFLILVFQPNKNLHAQSYFPFPTNDSAIWSMQHIRDEPGVCEESYLYEYVLNGDTVISGISYRKIYVQHLSLMFRNSGIPKCSHPPVNGYAGGFRDDTLTRKCYVILPDSLDESLVYDFNLEVGDTITSFALPPYFQCMDVRTIYSIDSIIVNGMYRKRQHICFGAYRVLEGVGSMADPFGVSPTIKDAIFICLRLDTSVVYSEFFSPLCTFTDSQEELSFNNLKIEIYPNPATNAIAVKTNVQIEKIEIVDLMQNVVIAEMVFENPFILDQNVFKSGVYFVKLISKNTMISVKKLMVF